MLVIFMTEFIGTPINFIPQPHPWYTLKEDKSIRDLTEILFFC